MFVCLFVCLFVSLFLSLGAVFLRKKKTLTPDLTAPSKQTDNLEINLVYIITVTEELALERAEPEEVPPQYSPTSPGGLPPEAGEIGIKHRCVSTRGTVHDSKYGK